jgi:hypothetical protein
MIILRYIASVIVWLIFWILGFPMVALGLLFCNEQSERMPRLFCPWDNFTSGINGTLNGNNPNWPRITNGKNRTYRYRWLWLAWRNPVSGASYKPLGVPITAEPSRQEIGRRIVMYRLGKFFSLAMTLPWFLKRDRGVFLRFGWKLNQPVGRIAQLMIRISPWKSLK